jgi:hypothetical protein
MRTRPLSREVKRPMKPAYRVLSPYPNRVKHNEKQAGWYKDFLHELKDGAPGSGLLEVPIWRIVFPSRILSADNPQPHPMQFFRIEPGNL